MIRRFIRMIAIGFALFLLSSGIYGYIFMGQEPDMSTSVQSVQSSMMADVNARQERIESADFDNDVDFATGADIAKARQAFHSSVEDYGIGSIYIPSSEISVPLLVGTSEWNLFNGVATGKSDQELGEELFVGLSHNVIGDTLLKRIDQMVANDLIYVTDFSDVYLYRTLVQEVVHESDTTYFEKPAEDDPAKLLMYRCEGETGTEWRRVVYAEYVGKNPLSEIPDDILAGLGVEREILVDDDVANPEPEVIVETVDSTRMLQRVALKVYECVDSQPIIFAFTILSLAILYRFV